MKKIIISFFGSSLIFLFIFINVSQAAVLKTSAVKKTTSSLPLKAATTLAKPASALKPATSTKPASPAKIKETPKPKPVILKVTWTNAALKVVNKIPRGVRPAYKKKVEDYARRNKVKTITPKLINEMRE